MFLKVLCRRRTTVAAIGLWVVACLLGVTPSRLEAVELDTVYRLLGDYRVSTVPGLRVYYPVSCQPVLGRVMDVFTRVRDRYKQIFPELKDYPVSVLLTDHDDRDTSKSDATFDLITLSLAEETGSLSTRGYSLEQRFSLRLAFIMVLRSLGSSHAALKRRLALLSIPPWFLEGLAMHYAFPMDALHQARLLELARTHSLFDLDDLDTIQDQNMIVQEEMRFQARQMLDYWHEISSSTAGLKFLDLIRNRPAGFDQTFRDSFGFPLKEGLRRYNTWISERCRERECDKQPLPETLAGFQGKQYQQSVRLLSNGEYAWVSSGRYRDEVYDLWVGSPGKARPVLKNVHPILWVDAASQTIYLGKYEVNARRQRRLKLYEVPKKGKPRRLVSEDGSHHPLGMYQGRLMYVSTQSGVTSIKSVTLDADATVRLECAFPVAWRPLEIAWDETNETLYFVLQFCSSSRICRMRLSDTPESAQVILEQEGRVQRLHTSHGRLYAAREIRDQFPQIYCIESASATPDCRSMNPQVADSGETTVATATYLSRRVTSVPGGVWDFAPATDTFIVTTVRGRGFIPTVVAAGDKDLPMHYKSEGPASSCECPSRIQGAECMASPSPTETHVSKTLGVASITEPPWQPYGSEFRSSYWLPKITRDDQGAVGGFYSYRADRLDRQRIIVSPTYGFKSRDWGYLADYQRRWGLFSAGLTMQDRVVRKSYLSNSYYERVHSADLHFDYPFSLSTSVTVGGNLSKRAIAEFPDNPTAAVPTVGRDNSVYINVKRRSIRSEPLWEVFPRRGREIDVSYRKGLDMFDGNLKYDSMSIRWNEYVPLPAGFVGTMRVWFAEDDKEGGIRRPDDLSLGGSEYLRGFAGSVRFGDSLRYTGLHLGHPVNLEIPWLRRWVQKEIIVLEGFAERGDVRSEGRSFDYLTDYGVEVRAKGLLLRRLPVTVRMGQAWPRHGDGKSHSYWTVDFSTLTSLIK